MCAGRCRCHRGVGGDAARPALASPDGPGDRQIPHRPQPPSSHESQVMFAKPFIPAVPAAAALIGCQGASPADSLAQSLPKATPTPAQAVSASRRTAITEAVARVAPAVVTVQTEVVERVPVDPFDMLFGRQS